MARLNVWAVAGPRILDDNGDGVSGGLAYVYEAGTTTQITLTSDLAGSTPLSQPVTADSAGRLADAYCLPQAVKIVYQTAAGATLHTIDNLELGSGAETFETRTAAAAESIPASTNFIRTSGYASRGDGGHGLYVRAASEPAHGLKFTSADGAFWEFIPEDGIVNTRAAGAVCDVTGDYSATSSGTFATENTTIAAATDDTAAIQAAIDYAIYYSGNQSSAQPVRVIHTGKSRITDTIHLGYGDGTATSVCLESPWAPLRGEDSMAGAGLFCTFSDRPMVNFQGVRGAGLKNIFLRGGLDYTGVVATNTGTTPTTESNWDSVKAVSQYAPFALITVDAYCGTEPGSPYPDVTYPSYLTQTQYGKAISSRVLIEGVIGRNAQVFVCVKPSDDQSNADFVNIKNCYFEYGKHAVSIGNGQSRNVAIEDCVFNRVFDAFVNGVHGRQAGQFGGPIKNCSFGGFCNKIFRLNSTANSGTTLTFENLFAENLHMIGEIEGATSGDTPLMFHACRFNFRWDDLNGVPPIAADFSDVTAGVRFEGCSFTGFPDLVVMHKMLNGIFDNCEMADAEPSSATRLVHNATTGGLVLNPNPQYRGSLRSVAFSQRALSTGAETRVVADHRLETTGRNYCVPLWLEYACHSGASTAPYQIDQPRPFYRNSVAKSTAWSSASRSNKVITATYTSITIETLFWRGGYIGDLWIDETTGTAGYVSGAVTDGADVDLELTLLTNYQSSDGGSTYSLEDTAFSLTTGNVAFLNCRIYATQMPMYGVSTASSTTLACASGSSTAIATILGDISTAGSNTAGIRDMIASAHRTPNHYISATAAEVASISSPNITMGGNATETHGVTGRGIPVNYWVRDEV